MLQTCERTGTSVEPNKTEGQAGVLGIEINAVDVEDELD